MDYLSSKLEAFRAHLQAEQRRGLLEKGYTLEHHGHEVRLKIGRKYVNVDVGGPSWSGCYMVDIASEEIFGIKAYGVIHRGHQYGTLDTISEWDWSGYRAVRKPAAVQS